MNYENLTSVTLWLADDNNVIKGTKEERAEIFRAYLDLLDIQSEFNPIPRAFAKEMLEHCADFRLHLSPIEKKCISWNAGRQTYARYPEQILQAAAKSTKQEQMLLVANPKPEESPTKKTKGKT
jgi:hypothetical protein